MDASHGVNADFQDRKYTGLTGKGMTISLRVSNRCGCDFLEEVYESAVATDSEGGLILHCGPGRGVKRIVFDNLRE